MAYYLRREFASSRIASAGSFSRPSSGVFDVELKINVTNGASTDGNYVELRNGMPFFQIGSNGSFQVTTAGVTLNTPAGTFLYDTIVVQKVRFNLSTNTVQLLVYDATGSTLLSQSSAATIVTLPSATYTIVAPSSFSTANFKFNFYYLRLDGLVNLDADLSGGTGLNLPEGAILQFGGWPQNNSQWVFYSDGAAPVEQIITSGGTLTQLSSAIATALSTNTQAVSTASTNTQLTSALASTAFVNNTANEQAVSTSGTATQLTAAQASTSAAQAQAFTSAGQSLQQTSAIASTASIQQQVITTTGTSTQLTSATASTTAVNQLSNAQAISTSGIATQLTSTIATTAFVNTQSNVQTVSTSATGIQQASAIAATSLTHSQQSSTSSTNTQLSNAIASTTAINEFTVVQAVNSGGITTVYSSAIATTQAAIEQVINSGGTSVAVTSGVASTSSQQFDGEWGAPVTLFSEALPIQQISTTFDQLGRPLVFYRTGADTLKLFFYDATLQQNTVATIAQGVDPTACFDFPQDTGQSFTDALLFYVRDNQVFMRIQRDRYAIEYPCPAIQPGLKINSAGLRVDNRLQVVYQFEDNGFVPPVVPVPPVVINAKAYYLNSWGSCLLSNYSINVADDPFSLGFTVRDAFYPRYTETGQFAFKQLQFMFGAADRTQFRCAIYRDSRSGNAVINLWRGRDESNGVFMLDDFNGVWQFDFRGRNSLVTITKDASVIYEGSLSRPRNSAQSVISFAGSPYSTNDRDTYPFHGVVHDCWIDHNGNRIDWPVSSKASAQQPSLPIGTDLTIINHNPVNWRLVPD